MDTGPPRNSSQAQGLAWGVRSGLPALSQSPQDFSSSLFAGLCDSDIESLFLGIIPATSKGLNSKE